MFFSLSTLLRVLAASAASIPFVAAQNQTKMVTTEQLYGTLSSTTAPAPGFNVDGGSVFTNFVNAVNNKQFFLSRARSGVYEKPGSGPVPATTFDWCSDLTFSDLTSNSSLMGYAGRCVTMVLDSLDEAVAAGAQGNIFPEEEFGWTYSISAVFVEQLNVFEGQYHANTDDLVFRYWDDGRKIMPTIAWEGHDEGDMHPNAATSSWSAFAESTWMTVEEVAQLLNTTSTDDFTPNTFKQIYLDTWIKDHEKEAAENNPNPEAELAIIEQVMNETNSAGETTSTAETNTEGDGGSGTNTATPIEDDDSASGRKLTSATARFVSAALRVFGI